MLDYTIEIWVRDARTKAGERLFGKYDYHQVSGKWMQEEIHALRCELYPSPKYRIELYDTYVTRRNALTGAEYQERYDTPYVASPSSETYWSM
jgi:hypothetical protein